ncbi:MAG: MoaD family protein [Hadesarchaea archaeon]|nr:MoaD family protein [Hadesarchaea archaeon]
MPITVKFFASFREATGREQEIVEEATDVASLLEELTKRFGGKLNKLLYEPDTGKLRDTVNILVNGRGINLLSGLETKLKHGDVVAIFPPVSGGAVLTPEELERYNRQTIIPGFEERGQRKLKKARVLVAGLGGLGSPASAYLVAAGVGHLTILDAEQVELSNLNRQILHWSSDVGRPKAVSAIEKLSKMNPNVKLESRQEAITRENAGKLVENADVVVDGMDNYPARYLLNEACVRKQIPFIHGAVEGLIGQLTTIVPGRGPCLRCIFPREPPAAQARPVLGPTPGVVGCLQAMEAIKLIVGLGKPLVGQMLLFDGGEMIFDIIQVRRNSSCPICGNI